MDLTSPLTTYLSQLMQNLPKDGAKASDGTSNSAVQAPGMQQIGMPPQAASGNPIGQYIEGSVGGLMGGSGGSGGQNSLMQGLGFLTSPSGAVGPMNNSSMATTALNALKGLFA